MVPGILEVALDGLEAVGSSFGHQLALDGSFRDGLDACIGTDVHDAGVDGSSLVVLADGSSVVVLAGNIAADGTSSSGQTEAAAAVEQRNAGDASSDHGFLGTREL